MNNISIGTKLVTSAPSPMLANILMISGFSFITFQQINAQWSSLETNEIAKKDLISDGNRIVGDAVHHFKNYILRGDEYDRRFSLDIEKLKSIVNRYRALSKTTAEERVLLTQIDSAADTYLMDMATLVRSRSSGSQIEEMDKSVKGADKPIYIALEKLQSLATKSTTISSEAFGASLEGAKIAIQSMMLFAVLIMLGISVFITLGITQPLRKALEIVNHIADGNLQNQIDSKRKDEIGQLLGAMKRMSDTLKNVLLDTTILIKAASDGKLNVRTEADRLHGEFRNLVAGFNQAIESFSAPINIASRYVDQIASGKIPETINTNYKGEYRVICNNLNTLIQMIARLHGQINLLILATANGEVDKRADATLFDNEWKNLVAGMNQALDSIIRPINEVVDVLAHIEQGNLTRNVEGNYQGTLGDFKDCVNNTIAQLGQTIAGHCCSRPVK